MLIGSVIVGGLLLLLLIPTFRAPQPQVGTVQNGTAVEEGTSRSQCERTLMSAMDGMQPDRLGISSEVRVIVDTLNNWAAQCVDPSTAIVDPADSQLREQLLTAEGFRQSQADRFQLRDAEHVRNSLLAADVVERITAGLRTDQQRALELFYYVVRMIELLPEEAPDLQLTPYESLVFGIGTPADRGWTYALLMRQLRLDVVMIQPRGGEPSTYWLLGAVIPGEGVLLLDPRMGLPISPKAEMQNPQTLLPEQAATLAEVRQNEQLLRQYDRGDRKYPLTSEDLNVVDVYAIGTSSTFAPRVGRLQAVLPEVGELFDGLTSNELREVGLIDRLVAAGEDGLWSREQVHIWPYPQRSWSETEQRTDEQKQQVAAMQGVINGPLAIAITVSVSDQDELQLETQIERPQRSLLEARIEQLLGNFASAQQAYLQTRLSHVNLQQVQSYLKSVQQTVAEEIENPQEAQQTYLAIQQQLMQQINGLIQNLPQLQLNAIAADMATFWAAQIHYEQQDFRLAAESALAYGKRGGGNFLSSANYLASLSLARDERPAEAVALAVRQPAQVSGSLGYAALVERWRKLSGDVTDTPTPPAEADTEKPPADPKKQPEAESSERPAGDKPEPNQPEPSSAKPAPESDDTPAADKADMPEEPAPASDAPAIDDAGTDEAPAVDQSGTAEEPSAAGESAPSTRIESSTDQS
jgi:hypothetical protein